VKQELLRQIWKVDWIIGVAGDAAQIIEGAVAAGFNRAKQNSSLRRKMPARCPKILQPGESLACQGFARRKMERIAGGSDRCSRFH